MVKVNWTLQSVSDLENIADFISRDSRKFAAIQVRRIIGRTKTIKSQPYSGRVVPELNDLNIRELIMGNYRIIYEIISDSLINIFTIHHSARLIDSKKLK